MFNKVYVFSFLLCSCTLGGLNRTTQSGNASLQACGPSPLAGTYLNNRIDGGIPTINSVYATNCSMTLFLDGCTLETTSPYFNASVAGSGSIALSVKSKTSGCTVGTNQSIPCTYELTDKTYFTDANGNDRYTGLVDPSAPIILNLKLKCNSLNIDEMLIRQLHY